MLPSYRNQSVDLDHIETNQLTGFYRMGTLALTFMIGCKYYKRNHRLWRYISLYSNLGRYIHRIYRFESNFHISPSVLSRGLKVVPSYSLHHCSHHSMIHPNCCVVIAYGSSWGISALTTVPDGIFFPLSLSRQRFWPYFDVIDLWVSCSSRHLHLLGQLLSGVSSKFLRNLMGNSYSEKDYSKSEVNVVIITQIRLQKMKNNVAMASTMAQRCQISSLKFLFYFQNVWFPSNVFGCLLKF